jgi:hypothetical protein
MVSNVLFLAERDLLSLITRILHQCTKRSKNVSKSQLLDNRRRKVQSGCFFKKVPTTDKSYLQQFICLLQSVAAEAFSE